MKYKKIFITGIYGSGKTTLSKKISKKSNIKMFELDDIKYLRHYDRLRSINERKVKLKNITKQNSWIIEGSWLDSAQIAYEKADIVIYMNTPEIKLYHRIIIRWIKRKLTDKIYTDKSEKKFGILRNTWKYFHDKNYYFTKEKHINYIKEKSIKYLSIENNKDEKIIENLF